MKLSRVRKEKAWERISCTCTYTCTAHEATTLSQAPGCKLRAMHVPSQQQHQLQQVSVSSTIPPSPGPLLHLLPPALLPHPPPPPGARPAPSSRVRTWIRCTAFLLGRCSSMPEASRQCASTGTSPSRSSPFHLLPPPFASPSSSSLISSAPSCSFCPMCQQDQEVRRTAEAYAIFPRRTPPLLGRSVQSCVKNHDHVPDRNPTSAVPMSVKANHPVLSDSSLTAPLVLKSGMGARDLQRTWPAVPDQRWKALASR